MQRPVTDDFMDPRVGERLTRAARAAQTLSEALWEVLHEELGAARQDRVAEFSERLSDVSKIVASLARAGAAGVPGSEAPAMAAPAHGAFPAADRGVEHPRERLSGQERPWGGGGPHGGGPQEIDVESRATRAREHDFSESFVPAPPAPTKPGEAVLVDERAPSSGRPQAPTGASAPSAPPAPAPIGPSAAPVAQSESPPRAPAESGQASSGRLAERPPPEIEIKDERREHTHRETGQAPGRNQSQWIASIERRLERYERDRLPFAVMLIELVDVERLRHAELPGEMVRMTGSVETALSGELRPADSLMRESPGRYWLLAPETDSAGARVLAERLSQAVRGVAGHRGAPLEIAVGIAVCPPDGNQAVALAARADIALYAARAAGRPVAP